MSKGKASAKTRSPSNQPTTATLENLFQQALAMHQQGDLPAAENLYHQVLAQNPAHLDAIQFLGILHYQSGQFESAAKLLQHVASKAPNEPGLQSNLGLALQKLGRAEQALACHERALALKPDFAEAFNNHGTTLRDLKRMREAAASFERALQLRPDFVEAHYNLGCTLLDLQQPAQALERFRHCLNLAPSKHEALGQCGVALMTLKQPEQALTYFERALQLQPADAESLYWRGNALLELKRTEEAVASFRQTLHFRPEIAEAHYNLGNALLDLQEHKAAIAAFDRALALRPGYVEAHYNRGGALQETGQNAEAAIAFQHLQELAPGHRYTLGKLHHSRQFCCDWSDSETSVESILAALISDKTSDAPFSFLAISDDPAMQLRCARDYTSRRYPASPAPIWAGERYTHDRIRVAYVSTDFRDHAVSYLLAGVFEAHDRKRFEIIAISLRPQHDSAMGKRVVAAFDQFIDASRMRDTEVAALMRELEVDIAVDLNGFTEDNRTDIFALRPAPVQVNYLGFPGGMGAEYIDYILADAFVIPEASKPHYAEEVVYLPDCFQANDDQREIAEHTPSRIEAGLPETGFVFCAFNNVYKLNPPMFDIWMRLLRAVPDSVLWLAADAPNVRKNLAAEAMRRGVEPDRLVFSPRIAYPEHLARMRLADLFLDTLPFNAGTTASDALWAGLPVLTCAGEAFAARMAGSLLNAVGLPELITHDLAEYEALALELATSPARMTEIKTRLAANRNSAPLFDTKLFCRNLETAYQQMWEKSQAIQATEPPPK